MVARIDQQSRPRRHELGRAADRGRDHGSLHRHPLERRLAEGLDQRRLAEHVGGRDPGPDLGLGDAAGHQDAVPALERGAQRPVADEGEPAAAEARERVGERDHVLALDQRADADERGSVAIPAELEASGLRGPRAEVLEIDAAVRDLDLRGRLFDPLGEAIGKPARVRDQPRGPPDDRARGAAHPADLVEVGDILAVGHDDERRPRRRRGDRPRRPGGKQDVGEDHVGARAPGPRHRVAGQPRVLGPGRPRWSIATTSTWWSRASSSRTTGTRKLPRSGSAGPGHIWVQRRIRTAR